MAKKSILLIEDEDIQRETLAAHLEDVYHVYEADSAEKGLNILANKTVDVVLTDFNLPGKDGQHVLEQVKALNPTIPVILITAFASVDGAVTAMQSGAYHYLTKPINVDELMMILKRALQLKMLESENLRLKEMLGEQKSFGGIIASSQKMQQVLNLAGRVAETKASILLNGESGTGKEVMARAIHLASPRQEQPFVAFNVAALSPNLIESELFGHEKGAFTGADKQRIGRFEQASGGTIFIDEIGDIPLEIQTKFLRVLQENQIERLGGNKVIDVDIRVVAATNKNLEAMIKEGTFREDLYYRLNVVNINLPPLRERKEDVPLMCDYFIKKCADVNGKNVAGMSREAFDAIMKYDFPGNVRELENMMERAVILCRDDQVTLDDLPENVFQPTHVALDENTATLEEQVEALEKRLIQASLRRCGGNQSKSARQLGISERKLRYKLQKYELA